MKRTEALAHFQEQFVDNTLLDRLTDLDTYFWRQKDILRQTLQDNFISLCQTIADSQTQQTTPVGFINLSLLRTSLLEDQAVYQWDVYGAQWYGDPLSVGGYYSADWAFDYLKQAAAELETLRRSYMGVVIRQDVGRITQREAPFFHAYVVALVRYMLRDVELIPEFQAMSKAPSFYICVGEYFDWCDIAYFSYAAPANPNKMKRRLHIGSCDYSAMKNIDFSHGDYAFSSFCFSDARGSDFSHSNLYFAQCTGTDFRGCRLAGADLKHVQIADADFSGCQLQQADLGWAEGGAGVDDEENLAFLGVNFQGSDLTDAFFTGADLRRADFRGAILRGTDFQDAKLKEAIFYTKDKEQLDVTPEQIAEIYWVDGG